jgi:deoxyribose-phosphate aldolase
MEKKTVASMIDHTLLSPEAGLKKIMTLCSEAAKYNFASVCINPLYVKTAAEQLAGSTVHVCTVIGFPLGAVPSEDKAGETTRAVKNGADEVDMVIDIGAALDGRFDAVQSDIASVVKAAREAGNAAERSVIVKVILETCFLSDKSIVTCCTCAMDAGADFVKTSTGFATPKGIDGETLPNGASVHHVALMRKTVGSSMGVKASGGIRSARTTISMLEAGANRIGTSGGVNIIETWDESILIKGYDC